MSIVLPPALTISVPPLSIVRIVRRGAGSNVLRRGAEAAKAQRPEILLITENKIVLLEKGRDGKFSAKSNAWEETKWSSRARKS